MKRDIPGCRHDPARMAQWLHDGACPICLTTQVSMMRIALRDTERALENLLAKLEGGQIEVGEVRTVKVNVTTALRLIPETKADE